MRFIRAFWGHLDNFNQRHKNEIIDCSKNKNLREIVYVWGLKNYNFIKSLGYDCELVSPNPTEHGEDFLLNSDSKRTCKTLTDYIEKYEPYVCNAKREDHFNQKEINQFISQYMKKDLYFQHI